MGHDMCNWPTDPKLSHCPTARKGQAVSQSAAEGLAGAAAVEGRREASRVYQGGGGGERNE